MAAMKVHPMLRLLLAPLGAMLLLGVAAVTWVELDAAHVFTPHHYCAAVYAETGLDADYNRSDFSCWVQLRGYDARDLLGEALGPQVRLIGLAMTLLPKREPPPPPLTSFELSPNEKLIRFGLCDDVRPFAQETPDAMKSVLMERSEPGWDDGTGRATQLPSGEWSNIRYNLGASASGWRDAAGDALEIGPSQHEHMVEHAVTLNLTASQLSAAFGCEP